MTASQVVTRFAPSPTGYLHIGGARTALFNWLYAKHTGGKFLLRIEDTDRARSTQEAIDALLDGLKWLGLEWDEEPTFQSQHAERHQAEALRLLAEGKAYYCYTSPEELNEMRTKARAEGRPPRYDGTWRDRSADEAQEGVKPVLRFRAPQTGETIIKDSVQGDVRFGNDQLDDMILLRSDGTPTYMLAVVVDDHDMGITHIVRGDDHLTNAARQAQLIQALGYAVPTYAHISLIHGSDGAKLSKRHGALGIEAYRDLGYLPEAMRNYLVRLGWSHGDDEIFTTEQTIEWFDLDAINKAPARLDFAKLDHTNSHYIRQKPDTDLADLTIDQLTRVQGKTAPAQLRDQLIGLMPVMKERAKTIVDLGDSAAFRLNARPLTMDAKAEKNLAPEARTHLAALALSLNPVDTWSTLNIEQAVRAYAEQAEIKLGGAAQPLRAAITGRGVSPPIFEVMAVLGKAESLARIADQASAS